MRPEFLRRQAAPRRSFSETKGAVPGCALVWPLDDELSHGLECLRALGVERRPFRRLQVRLRLLGARPFGRPETLWRISHPRDDSSGRDDTRGASGGTDRGLGLELERGERPRIEQ